MAASAAEGNGEAWRPPRVLVVLSRYNASVTGRLLRGAVGAYGRAGGESADLRVVEASGAFELPCLAAAGARSGRFGAVVALGCIVKGETAHDQVLAAAVTAELCRLSAACGVPVGLGVLTVNTPEQALERSGGRLGNKGAEAMEAALASARQLALLMRDGLDAAEVSARLDAGEAPDKVRAPRPGAAEAADRLGAVPGQVRAGRGVGVASRAKGGAGGVRGGAGGGAGVAGGAGAGT
ncbi:MAG: 6,7-dimethyl-8-ribityllumazine synthase, partial [Planctomyces sp.]|nr:6,7-dimethyl-8-ribityllumazine synthase [Planctomyces sp.]